MANPLTAPSGMGAALGLVVDAPAVAIRGLVAGEKERGEDAGIATRRGGAPRCGEAAGGLELSTTTS